MSSSANKIDSNVTGLAYAEEGQLAFLPGETPPGGSLLPGTPVWNRLEPNSYSDFGGELITVAPAPINPSRQRKKGVATDLNVAGGFNNNITAWNINDLLQGVMFATKRAQVNFVPTGVTAAVYTVPSSGTDLNVGDFIVAKNYAIAGNNGVKTVTAVTATTVACAGLSIEAGPPTGSFIRRVGLVASTADLTINVSGTFPALISASGIDWTDYDLVIGQWIFIGGDVANSGFANAENNGFKRIRTITATTLTFDKSTQTMVTGVGTGKTIQIYFGDVIKNEIGSLIVCRTYHIERTLGAPDPGLPAQIQSEVLKGCVANEFVLNIPTADLANVDFTFLAVDNEQRTGATGPKQSSVQIPVAGDVFNTSSDFSRLKMSLAPTGAVDENPAPLFAFVTEATVTISNNASINKAVGVFGGFDITAGVFQVSGSITAYFSSVDAIQAVRNNTDITLDMALIKDNAGFVLDIPLVSLGDGRLNVEKDQPITLPLSMDASTAEDIDLNLNHTAMFTLFAYVPNIAG